MRFGFHAASWLSSNTLLAAPATLRTGPSLVTGFLPALPRAFCLVVNSLAASAKAGDSSTGIADCHPGGLSSRP